MKPVQLLHAVTAALLILGSILTLSPRAEAKPGEELVSTDGTVTIEGKGFAANSTVVLERTSDAYSFGEVTASSTGDIEVTITIPDEKPAGDHTITATGEGANRQLHVVETAVAVSQLAFADGSDNAEIEKSKDSLFGLGSLLTLIVIAVAGASAGLITERKSQRSPVR